MVGPGQPANISSKDYKSICANLHRGPAILLLALRFVRSGLLNIARLKCDLYGREGVQFLMPFRVFPQYCISSSACYSA